MAGRIALFLALAFLGPAAAQDEPPPVTVLAPGIVARELPVRLTNLNNVRYAPDGRLFAVGYDGRVHVLTDTDGDGLEDRVMAYWDKKGELLTPLGLEIAPEGVYLASRGRLSLLRDTDKDGVADVCEIVADGWVQEKHNNNNRNDASGLALDAQGNLYFCLGCSDYSNAFLVDKQTGKSHYDLKSERGTILKISPDRKRREIVSTGIRFAVSLAFNKHGDLFATDQEGDTWFPGGNVLDELLHILPGRHYGFPYRHPTYLPDVVDEPAAAEFGPQHQSSCGFCFNEARTGRERFGPPEWEGDAIVTGFSRGKLWRVPLAKTRAGYLGRPVVLASFRSLPVDVALSPKGDLVVACHGGKPDWGSGPNGEGKLWKLSWTGKTAPQPVIAWPTGPLEVKVAFDRPVAGEAQGATLEGGEFVRAGDRFETIRPGYKVVAEQQRSPRHPLRVHSLQPSEDRRTLTLLTAAHPWRATYGLSVPGAGVELDYEPSGLEAEWTPEAGGGTPWKGWLPHPTLAVSLAWTRGSKLHESLASVWNRSGTLTMQGQLFPQAPGSALVADSATAFDVACGGIERKSERGGDGRHRAEIAPPAGAGPFPIRIALRTGGAEPDFELALRRPDDPHLRPLRADAFAPAWAPAARPPKPTTEKKPGGTAQGDPAKGREVFFGAEAR